MPSVPREVWGDLAATAFVEANVLFHSLDAEARQDVLQLAHLVDYQAGELIAADGEEERLLLVRDGTAAVLVSRDGAAVEVGALERNGIYGEGWVLGAPRPGALVARTPVSVVSFPAPVMAALAERFPRMRRLLETVRVARDKDAASRLGG